MNNITYQLPRSGDHAVGSAISLHPCGRMAAALWFLVLVLFYSVISAPLALGDESVTDVETETVAPSKSPYYSQLPLGSPDYLPFPAHNAPNQSTGPKLPVLPDLPATSEPHPVPRVNSTTQNLQKLPGKAIAPPAPPPSSPRTKSTGRFTFLSPRQGNPAEANDRSAAAKANAYQSAIVPESERLIPGSRPLPLPFANSSRNQIRAARKTNHMISQSETSDAFQTPTGIPDRPNLPYDNGQPLLPAPAGQLPSLGDPPAPPNEYSSPANQGNSAVAELPLGSAPAMAPPPVQNVGGCYWLVSSRNAKQNYRQNSGCYLDVFQRFGDGTCVRSDIASLSAQISPNLPVCVVVHGGFVSWDDTLKESHEAYQCVQAVAQCPIQMIFFSWPSDGPYTFLLPIDIAIRGQWADFNGFYVARLVSYLPPSCPVCLVGHSFGCRTVLAAAHVMAGGEMHGLVFTGQPPTNRTRIVLAAAAVDHHWLDPGEKYERALPRAECVVNLRNQEDLPLLFYPLNRPFAGRSLARVGFTGWDRRRLGGQNPKAIDYDVTANIGHAHLWPQYFSNPQILAIMAPYICYSDRLGPQASALVNERE